MEAVTRLLPGALGNEKSAVHESFSEPPARNGPIDFKDKTPPALTQKSLESLTCSRGLLDYPHYTRPPDYRGWSVPQVLLSGNHEEIRRWRRKRALEKTLRNRPDLLTRTKASAAGGPTSHVELK